MAKASIAGVLAGTALVVPLASPAGAAVTVASSGGTVTVTVTGDQSVQFTCPGGSFAAAGITATPTIACSSVTVVKVNGDGGAQSVVGRALNDPAFAANPRIEANLAGGNDTLVDTKRADVISMGAGNDWVYTTLGAAEISLDLGSDTDTLAATTLVAASVDAVSTGGTVGIAQNSSSGLSSTLASGAEVLYLFGSDDDDTLDVAGVSLSSTIDEVSLLGQGGDDLLIGGPVTHTIYGGTGTNRFEMGSAPSSAAWSDSETDTIVGSSSGGGWIYDTTSLRSGGRTFEGLGQYYRVVAYANEGDTVARIRPTVGGDLLRTYSLNRPGQQVIPGGVGNATISLGYVGQVTHRNVVDVVATATPVNVSGELASTDILDVTVPTGAWTTSGTLANYTIDPADGSLATITAQRLADVRVHQPWTNANQGFAHRVHRDLMFAFATDEWRDATRDHLTAGSKTRLQVAQGLMDTDEYRGLDVDRVFVKYLRRTSDPSGRTYWINRLREGRALWRFRAQLFGSPEYFNKAGGTNESYVVKAYSDVLGRAPDPSGRAYWTNKLNNGADRGSVALQFINSPEARRRLVDDQFLRFLDRYPTAAEQTTWVAQIPSSDGEQRLVAFLVNSSAYFTRD